MYFRLTSSDFQYYASCPRFTGEKKNNVPALLWVKLHVQMRGIPVQSRIHPLYFGLFSVTEIINFQTEWMIYSSGQETKEISPGLMYHGSMTV